MMNAGTVSRVLALIPERTVRTQSGVNFNPEAANCLYPDRLAHMVSFLGWLSPLASLTRDDQAILGLIAANGRPVLAAEEDDVEEAELEAEAWEQPEVPLAPAQAAVLQAMGGDVED
jgi:hypothetical protein